MNRGWSLLVSLTLLLIFLTLSTLPGALAEQTGPQVNGDLTSETPAFDGVGLSGAITGNGIIVASNTRPQVDELVTFSLTKGSKCVGIRYIWEFGDGEGTSTDSYKTPVSHRYTTHGRYLVTVSIECSNDEEGGYFDTIEINVNPKPPAPPSISLYPVKPMVGGVITYTLSGGDFPAGTEFTWDFGDGAQEKTTDRKITHQYKRTGRFETSVRVGGGTIASRSIDLTLQKGDILVHCSDGALSKLTPGPWSHAAMYIGNDQVIEAIKSGVTVTNLKDSWFYPADGTVAVFRISGLSDRDRNAVVNWAMEKKGRLYDFVSVGTFRKQRDCLYDFLEFPWCKFYYCSELVWGAYRDSDINLDPIPGIVFPRTLVTGERRKTELVGVHIETVPDAGKDYTRYYNQLKNGQFTPPYKNTISSDNIYVINLIASNPDASDDGIGLTIRDPLGRILSDTNVSIPNASLIPIDYDGDGEVNDRLCGMTNPQPGEYQVNITPPEKNSTSRWSLTLGAWDDYQYSWVTPYTNVSGSGAETQVLLRIDEAGPARVITFPARGTAPLNVTLMDLSRMESHQTIWQFGDGTSAAGLKNLTHTYMQPGIYTASMTVSNGTAQYTVQVPITVDPPALQADFIATPTTGSPPLTVRFTDNTSGSPNRWNWTFGDGATSTERDPVHIYTGAGRYTVTLETRDAYSESITRKPQYIVVSSGRVRGPNGMIWITSTPSSAAVSVDGGYLGETPLQASGIQAGVHQIRLMREGYRDWTGLVEIRAGTFTYVPRVVMQQV